MCWAPGADTKGQMDLIHPTTDDPSPCPNREASDKKELADANSCLKPEDRCQEGKGPAGLTGREGGRRESPPFEQRLHVRGAEAGRAPVPPV